MTEHEFNAALKELAAKYFADTPIPADGEQPEHRLTPAKLAIPHFFSLREICEQNPALNDLITVEGSPPTTSTLTTATGAFCPALFNEELQGLPLWTLASPHFSDNEVMELISVAPTVFNHSPLGFYPESYFAWEQGSYTVIVDPASIDESLDIAYDSDKLLILFIGGDTLGVQLITGVRDMCSCSSVPVNAPYRMMS